MGGEPPEDNSLVRRGNELPDPVKAEMIRQIFGPLLVEPLEQFNSQMKRMNRIFAFFTLIIFTGMGASIALLWKSSREIEKSADAIVETNKKVEKTLADIQNTLGDMKKNNEETQKILGEMQNNNKKLEEDLTKSIIKILEEKEKREQTKKPTGATPKPKDKRSGVTPQSFNHQFAKNKILRAMNAKTGDNQIFRKEFKILQTRQKILIS